MKKIKFMLSSLSMVFAFAAALAFSRPATETAWFALDETSGAIGQYLGPVQPDCIADDDKFCAAEYPGVDSQGQPVGQRIQTIEDAVRLQ